VVQDNLVQEVCLLAKKDANIDSGCSILMKPYQVNVQNACSEDTPIRLANHSLVKESHKGEATLPFDSTTSIPMLVVPDLYEPLLSVAGLCDSGLTVVFRDSSCQIFNSTDVVERKVCPWSFLGCSAPQRSFIPV
jgi:hypothetical protein